VLYSRPPPGAGEVTEKPRWLRVRDFSSIRPFYVGFRIWVTGRPVFWRKGHVPKHRLGSRELHSCLWVLALTSGYMGNNTLQCCFCLDVRQSEACCPLYTCVDMRINAP